MQVVSIAALRATEANIVCLGSYPGIIQSILDFDFLAGKTEPSIVAIVAAGRKNERYFFGGREVLIPVYGSIAKLRASDRERVTAILNLASGRRVLDATVAALKALPNLKVGVIFAEGVPERHAIELYHVANEHGVALIGGASVGLMIPRALKLGAIGGVEATQLNASKLFTPGSVAVISSSGGMVNELIRTVTASGHALSFGLALGGERFPLTTPEAAFLAAEADPDTKQIVYFGELGGSDEYRLAELVKAKRVTKPVVAYIAGIVADLFETPPQFGHAKAMAGNHDESAAAKAEALRAVGIDVPKSYGAFVEAIERISYKQEEQPSMRNIEDLAGRTKGLITSSVSHDVGGSVEILGTELLGQAHQYSFGNIAVSMFLGKRITSSELDEFINFVLRLLVDHGPYVSGAVNTIVTARAGRDLVSSLASGLLTIGPRFGGAINQAADFWLNGVKDGVVPAQLVEDLARQKRYISGIGHRKYRIDQPDPRVSAILEFSQKLEQRRFTQFALGVEAETTHKKGNLILNVDGAIAAVLLDFLYEKEGYSFEQLQGLVDTEFFNALFVLSRSVGFMAHYFDQARLDEGLFRLSPDQVTHTPIKLRD